ncbi:MAG: IS91 family transposase [Acidobacteriaceae bacterium]|nr:IS91 family transposase [Acidobacteriaceae bacterium]
MKPPRPTVAEVFRQHEPEFLERWGHTLSDRQLQTLRDLGVCRTAALGAHLHRCADCRREVIVYNSCLNRHCPQCGSRARDHWLEKHVAELLPVPYSHVVFTLPHELIPLARQNPRVVYNLLFRAASQTLLTIAADPKRLGARLGFLAVLHTWDQKLLAHPHLHCLVPAGGLAFDQTRWIPCRHPHFFLPVKVLAAKFRGQFLALLRRAHQRGQLSLSGSLLPLQERKTFARFAWNLKQKDWVVYAKKPLAGPQHVIRYLAHYPHRVAIANGRLLRLENGQVTFRWRDSAHGNKQKVMTLPALEFMRRFLLHVLPRGFVKIRHFGYLANRERKRALRLCSTLLPPRSALESRVSALPAPVLVRGKCPYCQHGRLVPLACLSAVQLQSRPCPSAFDTS